MPLVDTLPHAYEMSQDRPVRLDLDGIVVPPDVDLTLVGTIHDGSCSEADYAAALFAEHYLLLMESYNWDPEVQKRFQNVSRGYPKALDQTRALETAQIEQGSTLRRNLAGWNMSVAEALYKSGVRVLTADASQADIRAGRWTDRATYQEAVVRVTSNAVTGQPVSERDMVTFAERDAAIVEAICEGISRLRREDPKLDPDETLKAVGMYGTLHAKSVADALTTLAAEQGVDSFSVNTRYEVAIPGQEEGVRAPELADRRFTIARMIRFYSDWLRTEPTDSDYLWDTIPPEDREDQQ